MTCPPSAQKRRMTRTPRNVPSARKGNKKCLDGVRPPQHTAAHLVDHDHELGVLLLEPRAVQLRRTHDHGGQLREASRGR